MTTRRHLLKLAANSSVSLALLPFARHMEAQAVGKLPKRFVFCTTANGIDPGYLLPEGPADKKGSTVQRLQNGESPETTRVIDNPLSEMVLPWWLTSLEPIVDRTTCITGLSGKMCRGWHTVGFGALGAYPSGDKGGPKMATIDGALSKLIPSIFPHVGVSANQSGTVSAVGPGAALPVYHDPIEVYQNLFGVISKDPGAVRRNQFDGRLLDFMASDVKRFRNQLPGEEKGKLDHYLNAYEQMSLRHTQLLAKKKELEDHGLDQPEADMDWEEKVEVHCDLVTQAMITGLTNVAAINTDGNGANGAMYGKRSGFDQPTGGHGFGHSDVGNRVKPFSYNVSMMAQMTKALNAVPEGDGTMLDNTVLLMLSTSGSTHHTRCTNFPMILIGNCNNQMRTGRHIQVPGYGKSENRTIGTLYTTLLHAAGFPPENGFGALDGSTKKEYQVNPMSELMV